VRIILLALLIYPGLVAQTSAPSAPPKQSNDSGRSTKDTSKQWEYKTVHSDADLNELIAHGWEFVIMSSDGQGQHYLLKRIKPDSPKDQVPVTNAQGSPVYKVGGNVLPPVLVRKIEATYTPEAQARRIRGVVELDLEVTPGGFTDNIRVVQSLDPGLDQRAIEALRQWRFRPGMKDGMPVRVAATVEVNFQLLYQ
jgi:TonB family protein